MLGLAMVATAAVAQTTSTYNAPFAGETHTYNVTSTHTGQSTSWYVATNANGTKAAYGNASVYTFVSPTGTVSDGVQSGTALTLVQIKWGTGVTVGQTYYVFFEAEKEGCTNRMALPVNISESDYKFNATAFNVTGAANYGTASKGDGDIKANDCPSDVVNPVWNGSSQADLGTTEVVFKVLRQVSLKAWQFGYAITGLASSDIESMKVVRSGGTEITVATTATTINMNAADDYALIYIKVKNNNTGTANTVNFALTVANTKDADNNSDYITTDADNKATYTIKAMPVVSGFGGI